MEYSGWEVGNGFRLHVFGCVCIRSDVFGSVRMRFEVFGRGRTFMTINMKLYDAF